MLLRLRFGRPFESIAISAKLICLQYRCSSQLSLKSPKGTRDFYPEDVENQLKVHKEWKEAARLFGFEQIDSPVVEYEELYDRDANEKLFSQYYRFQDSSKGHRLNLKADMTPSLCRMVVANHPQATYPLKWFSIPQLWRFEDERAGRRKEFYQWNMDIWGVPGIEAEAELLSAAVLAFKRIGLTSSDVIIKIGSRKLVADLMTELGLPINHLPIVCITLDSWFHGSDADRASVDFNRINVDKQAFEELVFRLKKSKLESLQSESKQEVSRLFELLGQYGISDWVTFDPTIVRGLGYYTGVVFEAFDRTGEVKPALCGGGRYNDMLLPMFVIHGEYPTAAVGFGMGDAALEELLKRRQ